MKRPKSHEIDAKAQGILRSRLPSNWVIREQHPDYGIDYEIEVFQEEQPAGIWFRIQLKGKEKAQETEDSIFISFETGKIDYYLSKVPFPVFLFVVVTAEEEIYWLFLQKFVNEVLKVENPRWMEQKSVTIKIPKKNRFSNNAEEIEMEARKGMIYTHLLVFETPHWSVPLAIKGAIDDIEKLEIERKRKIKEQNEFDLHLASTYLEKGFMEKSQQWFLDVFNRTRDQENHVLEHLSSIAGIISFYSVFDERQNRKIFELSEYGLEIAKKIQNNRFIHYFRGLFLEVTYYKVMKRIWVSKILLKIANAQKGGMGYLLDLFQSEDYKNLLEISKKYSLNIYESFKDGEYWVSLYLLVRLIRTNLIQYVILVTERTREELSPLLENASGLIENSLKLADALSCIELKCEIMKLKARLFHLQNRDEYKKVLESMKALALEHNLSYHAKCSDDLLHEFSKMTPFPEGPDSFPKSPPFEEWPDKEIDEMYKMLIEMAGIDLESDNDIAKIVRIGLEDRNPERILKNCSHLEVALGCYGIPGEMLGLPTAGYKFLFCKYGEGIFGLSLDTMYEKLREDHCTKCEHHDPMPEDWKWSLVWQKEKHEKRTKEFQKFIDEFNQEFGRRI